MAVTSSTDLVRTQIMTDAVRGVLKGKNGLIDSVFVTSGAIRVAGTMPQRGPRAIGTTIRVPYWGNLGDFESLAESGSATPQKLAMTYEEGTVTRQSIAFETSSWSVGTADAEGFENPMDVSAQEAGKSARRAMDKAMITAGATSPLLSSLYSATVPSYLTWQKILNTVAVSMGDESPGIVGMSCHSLVSKDLTIQTDSTGRQYLADPRSDLMAGRVVGIPIVTSDRTLLTGSTMGTMVGPYTTLTGTSAGTSSATFTIAVTDVTKLGPWRLAIEVLSTGECGTATIRFSTDGGNIWSSAITTSATGVATSLVDTAVDSLVGNNGKTGVSVTFTSGAGNDLVDGDFYRSTANLCCESQIWMPGAGVFWYNEMALALKTDQDILEDTEIGAMHLYSVPHVYRRRVGGSRPGVLRIRSNVTDFIGVDWAL